MTNFFKISAVDISTTKSWWEVDEKSFLISNVNQQIETIDMLFNMLRYFWEPKIRENPKNKKEDW